MKKKHISKWMLPAILATIAISLVSVLVHLFYTERDQGILESQIEAAQKPPVVSLQDIYPNEILPNSSLGQALDEIGVPPSVVKQLVDAAKPIQNLAKLRPGIKFQAVFNQNELTAIKFRFSAIDFLVINKINDQWNAEKITEKVDIRVVKFSGNVTTSLWDSARKSQMETSLIAELTDIFGWEIDFAREVRENDKWRITVEQKTVKGEFVGWGDILAAEYINAGEVHQAVLFKVDNQELGYFTPAGASLRKMFLKSPIRFGRITSGFSLKRFHPILMQSRPHLGVDYGAPIGTPVMAVGDGTVTKAGWGMGAGNVVRIRHNGTYETAYKHLNGFAKGIRNGAKVQQGQVIGFVGTTGLSTGPHLHFEFYQGGRYVDPLGKKFPSADPVPQQYLSAFQDQAKVQLSQLPEWAQWAVAPAEANTVNPSL
jgi:murein DD-endopeptidase MepM/ murein hydrolase activator NlpD